MPSFILTNWFSFKPTLPTRCCLYWPNVESGLSSGTTRSSQKNTRHLLKSVWILGKPSFRNPTKEPPSQALVTVLTSSRHLPDTPMLKTPWLAVFSSETCLIKSANCATTSSRFFTTLIDFSGEAMLKGCSRRTKTCTPHTPQPCRVTIDVADSRVRARQSDNASCFLVLIKLGA
jgi:hypothetical protein